MQGKFCIEMVDCIAINWRISGGDDVNDDMMIVQLGEANVRHSLNNIINQGTKKFLRNKEIIFAVKKRKRKFTFVVCCEQYRIDVVVPKIIKINKKFIGS